MEVRIYYCSSGLALTKLYEDKYVIDCKPVNKRQIYCPDLSLITNSEKQPIVPANFSKVTPMLTNEGSTNTSQALISIGSINPQYRKISFNKM